jgi:hypothetical protein
LPEPSQSAVWRVLLQIALKLVRRGEVSPGVADQRVVNQAVGARRRGPVRSSDAPDSSMTIDLGFSHELSDAMARFEAA